MPFDQDKPAAATTLRASNPEILENQESLQEAIDNEHIFSGTASGTQTGDHTQGSARAFNQESAPATRIDGDGFLSTDLGSIWIRPSDNQISTLTATLPTWTPVSDKIISTLLAQTNTWAEIQTFSKTPVLPEEGNGLAPVGATFPYAFSSAPDGYLLCQGQEVSRATFSQLDALMLADGYPFGSGDGSITFNLPDLRERVPVGVKSGGTFNAIGDTGGEEEHLLTGLESGVKPHSHTLNTTQGGVDTNVELRFSSGANATQSTVAAAVESADEAHNNMQPYLTLNYIIKF